MTGTSWGDGRPSGASSTLGGWEGTVGRPRAGDSEDLEPGGGATKGGDETIRRLPDWQGQVRPEGRSSNDYSAMLLRTQTAVSQSS